MKYIWYYETPIGRLGIAEVDGAISHILFNNNTNMIDYKNSESLTIKKALEELLEYFSGNRRKFNIPLFLQGTEFQKSVWKALIEIPFGETCSYKDIAVRIGNPKASRAVGMANNRNPIPIIIPCHRVIGSNKSLTGYAGGIELKKYLLDLEKNYV